MEEKYYEILRHYVNPNDCAIVVKQLLSLHNVSNSLDLDKMERKLDEVLDNETSEKLKEWLRSKRL